MFSGEIYMTFSPSRIKQLVDSLKKRKKKVVFTNGVFDILHYGHISYLIRARRLGDVLIVGMNSDSSVRKFKPEGRPIQNELDRAKILAALRPVDYVVRFSEETPERLIRLIRPDILVKGADYKLEDIVGADFVRSYGGQVRRMKLMPGRSSSKIIKSI